MSENTLTVLPATPVPCNRCGECCKVGGKCEMRRMHPMMIPIEFTGRCEFLTDLHDGTTQCDRMVGLDFSQPWVKDMIPGTCCTLDLKKEIQC